MASAGRTGTDEALVKLLAGCADGDAGALERLYRACAPKLFGLALRITRHGALAEDVLQEGMIRVWRRAGEYRPGRGSAMTWMASIVHNAAIDAVRRERVRDTDTLDEGGVADPLGPGPARLAETAADMVRLAGCLEALEPAQRECIVRAYCYGDTHPELARRVARPIGTVKTWIRRGLESLRRCLEPA